MDANFFSTGIGIVIGILCLIYSVIILLLPIFIIKICGTLMKIHEEQRRINRLVEFWLKKLDTDLNDLAGSD